MSLLSARQKDDLLSATNDGRHKAVLDYLHANNFHKAYDAFKEETGLNPDPNAQYTGLLEKKWTSVIRLQKKILDLETRNAALQEEVSMTPAQRSSSQVDWLPRSPAKHVLTGHRSSITRVAFHPVFSLLASGSEDTSVKIWDWETGEFERTLKSHTKSVSDVDFDSKGNFLGVSCSLDLTIKLWDTNNDYKMIRNYYGHDHSVSTVRFIPGDDSIISASRDKTLRVWDVASGQCVKTIHGHSEWVRYVVPSDDGKLYASASDDHTARVWNAQTAVTKAELRGHEKNVESVTFVPVTSYKAISELVDLGGPERLKSPGLLVVTTSRDKTIMLWDAATGQHLKTFTGHDDWVRCVVFHPNGKHMISASDDKTLKIWELSSGRCTKTVDAHEHFVTCIAWGRATTKGPTVNGAPEKAEERRINVLATGSVDQMVKVWAP
ncbi:protein with putative role during mitosis [Serendipita sp. 399]|nr:protein with putative role during mitosis [Serendipita sp. 399]